MGLLSELIKTRRQQEGFSLREFSEKCGLSHTYIKNLEESDPRTGKEIVPTVDSLDKIARALNMTLEELLKEIGYIKEKDSCFEPSNLRLIRGGKSFREVTADILKKTGREIHPYVYEDIEKGNDDNPSPFLIDILARYAGVERSFFYKKNDINDFQDAIINLPYRYLEQDKKKSSLDHISDDELKNFIYSNDSLEYLKLAKELYDKKIKVKFIRNIIFDE